MRLFLFCITVLLSAYSWCQDSLVIRVIDHETKLAIPFAKVYVVQFESGVVCNENGVGIIKGKRSVDIDLKVSATAYEVQFFHISPNTTSLLAELDLSHVELEEVHVSGVKGMLERESLNNVDHLDGATLERLPTNNLATALSRMSGVYATGNSAGIGKPVIRGLSGNRVVTYLNGIRLENQQGGSDHGLGSSSAGVGHVEVIKGPASLLYGPDALGGVLYLTDETYAPIGTLQLESSINAESNNLRGSYLLGMQRSTEKVKLSVWGRQMNAADYAIPSGEFLLNSRFKEDQFKFNISTNRAKWLLNVRYNFYQNRLGLPGHTHDSIIDPASFYRSKSSRAINVPAQVNQQHLLQVDQKFYLKQSSLWVNVGAFLHHLQEFEDKVFTPDIDLRTGNVQSRIQWKRKIGVRRMLFVGNQSLLLRQFNAPNAPEVLVPDAVQFDNGTYALLQQTTGKWRGQIGARVDFRQLSMQRNFKGVEARQFQYAGISGSASVSYRKNRWKYAAQVTTGIRPPNLAELLADGVHHGSFRYEKGDLQLQPEQGFQGEITIRRNGEHSGFDIVPFGSYLNNFIYLNPTDSLIDNYLVYEYQQTSAALLYGVDLSFHYHPHFLHPLHLQSTYSWIAMDLLNETATLPFQPAPRFTNTLRYDLETKKAIKINNFYVESQFFIAQRNTAEYETSSPAYHLLAAGIEGDWKWKNNELQWRFYGRNLLNETYIDHLSMLKEFGIQNPGFTVGCSIKLLINYQIKS